jgi:hypothetical protein
MLWHGRDLRQYKRLLSPPLEVLLTCPGVGGLGRGLASLPVASLAEAGLASGLSTLAEDAVAVSHLLHRLHWLTQQQHRLFQRGIGSEL